MEHDNNIHSLIEKTMHSICADSSDLSPWDRPLNAVEWWNDNESNCRYAGSNSSNDAAEWNLNRFNERLGEASPTAALVWKELEKPSVPLSSKKPPVTRLQDCFILNLEYDQVLHENDNNIKDDEVILSNPNVKEDPLDSLSWPYDSLFFSSSSKNSPCLWKGRKRRITEPSSTTTAVRVTTDKPAVALDPTTSFHDNFSHHPKFHVWNQDPMETSSSVHTRYDLSQPEATTPPPMRVRKRKKKSWNAANQQTIAEANLPNQSPKLCPLVRKESIDPSRLRISAQPQMNWLPNETSNADNDNDDSSTEASFKLKDDVEHSKNSTAVARFRQILQQKEPMTEADFMAKPNRALFHRLIYEQTMGVSLAALENTKT